MAGPAPQVWVWITGLWVSLMVVAIIKRDDTNLLDIWAAAAWPIGMPIWLCYYLLGPGKKRE